MKKYITYWKINKILKSIQKNCWYNNWFFLEIEIKEIIDLWFLKLNNTDITLNFNGFKITNEWDFFLIRINFIKKSSTFFKSFLFFEQLLFV